MNPLHGIWRGKKQTQQRTMFVHDLLCFMYSKKHNGWQEGQTTFCLVFTNSHESKGILWAKGLPSASYLRANECPQLGKAFDETCGAGSVRNPTSRDPAAGAVVPGEIRDIDIRGQKKKTNHTKTNNQTPTPKKPLFLRRGLH